MSGRLKVLLAVLAVGAGSTFWYATNYSIIGSGGDTLSSNALNAVAITCADTDADALCDFDETYWGTDFQNPDTDGDDFKDGEEVLTGHNPNKKGPDDFLNDRRNLTERASSLLLGGIITGSLKPDSPTYKASIDALVDEIFKQYDANVASDLDSVVLASGSLDSVIGYAMNMTTLMQPMFAEINANYKSFLETIRGVPLADLPALDTKNPEAFKAFVAAADAEATAFADRTRAIKKVRVPPQLVSFHRSMLQYLSGAQQRYIAVRTINRDPLMGMISLQVIRSLAIETPFDLTLSFQNQVAAIINSK